MSGQNKPTLNERMERKKRVKRLKKAIISFVVLWMFICMLLSIVLMFRVSSLQKQIDVLMENVLRSQQQISQEEQQPNPEDVQAENEASDSDLQGGVFSSIDVDEDEEVRKVYLTFDDGPSANTGQILDILDQYQIKATFFVIGKEDETSDALYKEIVARGHTIGMHSYSHKYNIVYESLDSFAQDLSQIKEKIYNLTGVECQLYRFPGGSSNQVSNIAMTEFIRYLNEQEIVYFDWNVECGDATANDYSVDQLVDNVMKDVVKHNTCVVLMHDSVDKPKTVEALPKIIEQILALDDTQILPIEDDTTPIQHVLSETVED